MKQKVIRFGKRIFFSNFITGSLILFYVMLLYAIISREIDSQCDHDYVVALLAVLAVSDFIMITQHVISFFAMINHSGTALIGCIVAHTISVVLKIIGGIMMIRYAEK